VPYFSLTLTGQVLHLRLLSYFKRIFNLNAEIANSALQVCMSGQKLDGSQVFRPSIDQYRLRSPHCVDAISRYIQTNRFYPAGYDARVLAGGQMRRLGYPAWKDVLIGGAVRFIDPSGDRLPGLFGDFKLHWLVCLALHDHSVRQNGFALGDITIP
jgi:hypothetical protein